MTKPKNKVSWAAVILAAIGMITSAITSCDESAKRANEMARRETRQLVSPVNGLTEQVRKLTGEIAYMRGRLDAVLAKENIGPPAPTWIKPKEEPEWSRWEQKAIRLPEIKPNEEY